MDSLDIDLLEKRFCHQKHGVISGSLSELLGPEAAAFLVLWRTEVDMDVDDLVVFCHCPNNPSINKIMNKMKGVKTFLNNVFEYNRGKRPCLGKKPAELC